MLNHENKLFTIPNMISVFRILLVPVFSWAYMTGFTPATKGRLIAALVLVILSGVSDKLDGAIARRTHQVSNVGKLLDPLADKLTQIVLAVLLFVRFHGSVSAVMRQFAWVFLLFIGKEVLMLLVALTMLLLKLRPTAAEFWGKAATVAFYIVMSLLVLAGPDVGILAVYVDWALPNIVTQVLVYLTLALTFLALFSYIPDTYRMLIKREGSKTKRKE
ncbi:MAG: CDP-alcohol phosphatidyltransferase family protein [Oscillospiraceae bacterium]|jgi:cardiolipin synthase|nr:CDP-alcohol phosphatidyltransferase family protein [Oscillospiraceae bacterium]